MVNQEKFFRIFFFPATKNSKDETPISQKLYSM